MLDMGELARSMEAMEHLRQQAVKEGVSEEEVDRIFANVFFWVLTAGLVFGVLLLIGLVILDAVGVAS